MEKQPRQFGVFALFIFTTAAAASFAIIRLPLPLVAKIVMVQSVVVCFLGWALRNRKYPDPRQVKMSPAVRRLLAVLNFVISTVWLAVAVWFYVRIGPHSFLLADFLFGGALLSAAAVTIWQAIKAIRLELKRT